MATDAPMDWSSPPPGLYAPSPTLKSAYEEPLAPIPFHSNEPVSDAISVGSTTTPSVASAGTHSTLTSAGTADTNTSVGTTPEPIPIDSDVDHTGQGDKHSGENATDTPDGDATPDAGAQNAREDTTDASCTSKALPRRRSARFARSNVAASNEPATPAPQQLSTVASNSTVTRKSLRSADRPKESQAPTEESEIASQEQTRRKSTRIGQLSLAALLTPAPQGAKRPIDAVTPISKSAGPKLGGTYGKRIKTEENAGKNGTSPAETPKASPSLAPVPREKRKKVWINQGLYVGQDVDFDPKVRPQLAKKKGKGKGKAKKEKQPILPLPTFIGKQIMETQRDFKMPYHIFAPSPYVRPQTSDWRKLNHNVFIGDASQYWKKEKPSNLKCVCQEEEGCNEHCLNRCTWLECDEGNCNIGRGLCRNRAFADLKERVKSGTKFAEGVEIVQTPDRGVGLRATRSFSARQIIVEYTGEIITQEESERRMCEDYKKNKNYYLMLFDQNMILDATRGSVARFVNHSCEPNCRMEKWIVEGKPRMALFAGDVGIDAGDELTYDYNFNWFTGVDQQPCKCGSANCRGTLGKRTDVPTIKKQQPSTPSSFMSGPPMRKKDAKKVKAGKAAAAAAAARKAAFLASLAEKANPKPGPVKQGLGMSLTAPVTAAVKGTGRGRPRKQETLQQRAVIYSPKPKRKAPFARRASSPRQIKERSPSLSPALTVSTTSVEDDSEFEDIPQKIKVPVKTEAPSSADKRKRNGRPRITRTYNKINKTIAPTVATRTITSQPTLDAAKETALQEAQKITEEKAAEAEKPKPKPRGRPPKTREGTPKVTPKAKPAAMPNSTPSDSIPLVKRGRGRPPKNRPILPPVERLAEVQETAVKSPEDMPVENMIVGMAEKLEGDDQDKDMTAPEGRGGVLAAIGESLGGSTTVANVMNVVGILNPINVTA